MEATPFFIALYIHLIGLIVAFGSVMVTDLFGLLWILDRVRFPQIVNVSQETKNFIWVGWGIMVLSGMTLIYYKGEIDNLTTVKLFFVALIGVNGVFLHFLHEKVKHYKLGENIPNITMFRLMLALTVSQVSWWSAFTIGFLHRHIQTVIDWPASPRLVCTLILLFFLVVWVVGEKILKVKQDA
ncbi:MAG: hypothetical protein WD595_03095 [Waddliaceae bacterium]